MRGNRSGFLWGVSKSYEWIGIEDGENTVQFDRIIRLAVSQYDLPIHASPLPKEDGKSWFLTDGVPVSSMPQAAKRYDPFAEYPGLFLSFAYMYPSQMAISSFAKCYGMLGLDKAKVTDTCGSMSVLVYGESFNSWIDEIQEMRDAVQLWRLLAERDTDLLSRHIVWDQRRLSYYRDITIICRDGHQTVPRDPEIIASEEDDINRELLWDFVTGEVTRPAIHVLCRMVNKRLPSLTTFSLTSQNDNPTPYPLRLQISPTSLLGALWLQFSDAIDKNTEFRRCQICRSWFPLDNKKVESVKKYCSDACRLKAYRAKQARAVKMHESTGKSPEEIAALLESDVRTVIGWIKRAGSK